MKGTAWAWGWNAHGQLGNGATNDATVPVQVSSINLAATLWAFALDTAGGWKVLGWFGFFLDQGDGWVYHAELGWQYGVGTTPASFWLWSSRLHWLWSSANVYPFFWYHDGQAWLWYYRGTGAGAGGWFHNFGTGQNEWH